MHDSCIENKVGLQLNIDVVRDSAWILCCLVLLNFFSALALIYVKFENQLLYSTQDTINRTTFDLKQQQNKLLLELAAESGGRMVYERAIRSGMRVPELKEIVLVEKMGRYEG